MIRRERLIKCINILSLIYPKEKIMSMSPVEIENETYKLLLRENEIVKEYLEEVYDKKKDSRADREVSKAEKL